MTSDPASPSGPGQPGRPVVLISGGGSGIGAAVALRAARSGSQVVICGRRQDSLDRVAAQADPSGSIATVIADVTVPADVDALVAATLERHGRIDQVVANAGVMRSGTVLDTAPQEWAEVIGGNLTSAYLLVRTALPHLLVTRGTVVGVSSIAGLRSSAGAAAYSTAKAAMIALMRSVAVDFAGAGVRANVVCPGWVRTEMADEEMAEFGAGVGLGRDAAYDEVARLVPQQRAADPDEVAAAVLWLLGPESSYVNGSVLTVDGGTTIVDAGTVAFDHAVTRRDAGKTPPTNP